MRTITPKQVAELQKSPKHIRNICILAHVDHGKTTLADSILASNGIISPKLAGKMRYMDSRKDEQERGITMKSSSVAIHYSFGGENYLINLIDSPGHVDFSGEVSTAVRLCDGAIVLVDVIEGVCSQTKVALHQAWVEHIRPVLVLNKIDRLILEWKLTPLDAYAHLVQILEQVNAVIGELFASDILQKSDKQEKTHSESETKEKQIFDWSSGLDDCDDSSVYFSPEQGNVVFASAIDGWGFRISHFAKIYAGKLGTKEEILKKTLWGDFYLNMKTKKIMKGAQAKAKKPLFVQLILENIWAVYESVLLKRDAVMTEKIVQTLNLKVSPRDAKHKDPKVHLHAIFEQWLPLARAVLEMVCLFVPSPLELSEEKVEGLMCSSTHKFESLPLQTRQLKKYFQNCDSSEDAPVIVCISKMFPVENSLLPKNRLKPLTLDELALRKNRAREVYAQTIAAKRSEESSDPSSSISGENSSEPAENSHNLPPYEKTANTSFIAFARVYSGTIKKGQTLYVLGPKHDPSQVLNKVVPIDDKMTLKDLHSDQHITMAKTESLYLLMGKELEDLDEVPAGNVLGIGGLEEHVLKSATLSSTIACPRFIDLHSSTVPIMRVAVEPLHPREMPVLVQGMRLLNQADPCVQVFIQESGEHVLVTAGEVHLQRCLDDLRERFAKVDINVSPPIVPFRETVVPPPVVDMVNEAIEEKNTQKKESVKSDETEESAVITIKTPNKMSTISIRAVPLPPAVTAFLEQNTGLLKEQDRSVCLLHSGESDSGLSSDTITALCELKTKLNDLFTEAGNEWNDVVNQIWAFGPKKCGPNILLNRIPNYHRHSVWLTSPVGNVTDNPLSNYDSSFVSGFQLATFAGPLCEEPMMGVCFIVEEWTIDAKMTSDSGDQIADSKTLVPGEKIPDNCTDLENIDAASVCSSGLSSTSSTPYGPFTGQIMSTVKEACRQSFQAQPQRLMAAMYSCNIQVTTEMLGKMYAVLGRRHGRVLQGDMQEGSQTFHVTAALPVIESFDFANEIRKQTSGMASPQLVFSHWEVVDIDPFWVPRTDEEYAHFGEKADTENRARKYMNSVRRRKGLPVNEKIVEHAEKQRTLARKK